MNYKTRMKQLNWKDIAFKEHTGEDCENRFKNHLKNVRRHRNLNEIVTDIETNIKKCPVKKPLNSYQIFIQDQLSNATTSGDFVCLTYFSYLYVKYLLFMLYFSKSFY